MSIEKLVQFISKRYVKHNIDDGYNRFNIQILKLVHSNSCDFFKYQTIRYFFVYMVQRTNYIGTKNMLQQL